MNNPDFEINLNSSSVENQTGNYEINNQPVEIEINLNAGARGLKGEKGDTGAQGPIGPQGPQGDKGDKGDTGTQGPQGIQGIQGEQGEQGPAGQDGEDGADGYSPSATVTKSGKVATITITDKDGTTTCEIRDGEDGQGSGDMLKSTYDTDDDGIVDNAELVNGHSVLTDVPADAVFTDTTYTAGTGIDITGNVISNTQTSAEWGNITGTLSNQTDLNTALSGKQATIDSSHKLSADLVDDTNTTNKFFSGNYNDLSNKPTIPDELADLTDDSTHRVVTDTEKTTWSGKQDALVSGTNIKTINSTSLLGSGNIDVGADIPQQDTAPSNPEEDDLWIDTDADTNIITIDNSVSTTSSNPISNQAITNYVNGTVLWTNSNPENSFAGQTIQISNLLNYTYIDIVYFSYMGNLKQEVQRHYIDSNYNKGNLSTTFSHSGSGYSGARTFYIQNNGIQFGDNYDFFASGSYVYNLDNNWNIPYKIIGYKN